MSTRYAKEVNQSMSLKCGLMLFLSFSENVLLLHEVQKMVYLSKASVLQYALEVFQNKNSFPTHKAPNNLLLIALDLIAFIAFTTSLRTSLDVLGKVLDAQTWR